jgi:hypothetical protein
VISTGSTLRGLRQLMTLANATVAGEMAVFTEGKPERLGWHHRPGPSSRVYRLISFSASAPTPCGMALKGAHGMYVNHS